VISNLKKGNHLEILTVKISQLKQQNTHQLFEKIFKKLESKKKRFSFWSKKTKTKIKNEMNQKYRAEEN
jgi:hypothetical protein